MANNLLLKSKVGIIGLGRSGASAANLVKTMGADVLVSDSNPREKCVKYIGKLKKGIKTEFGGHSEKLLGMNLIIKSPGVPNELKILKKIKKNKIPVWSELELALNAAKPQRVIAITGTNGKTTTTSLVGEIFKQAGKKTIVAGNIGTPLSDCVNKIDSRTNVILEVSSYQLEDSSVFHPQVSCILNIAEDHIEHHKSMQNYINAKAKIFLNQNKNDYCILNYDNKICRKLRADTPAKTIMFSSKSSLPAGVYYDDNKIKVRLGKHSFDLDAVLKIPGRHNMENALAAVSVAVVSGIDKRVIEKTIKEFKGVEHRIEFVKAIKGVKYINDSKATNVDSTKVALESFSGQLWLILGGRDKGFPYTPLRQLIKEKVKGILTIGEAAGKIEKDLSGASRIIRCNTLAKAVLKAYGLAENGDVVLLSPACASFDQFENFEYRGRKYKSLVKSLR